VTPTLTPAEVLDAGKERPILFSAPMVRAILAGTKTQTRRIVKPQPEYDADERWPGWKWPSHQARSMLEISEIPSACPYGRRGDRLWVRETHAQFAVGNRSGVAPQCVAYRATCDEDGGFDYVNNGDEIMRLKVTKWTPAIYMPRWASRITLEVTRVRVERLHDITEEDARMEGVTPYVPGHGAATEDELNAEPGLRSPRMYRFGFEQVWCDINGSESWDANPWVWVVEFKRMEAAARLREAK
jgi:hypothetical protein